MITDKNDWGYDFPCGKSRIRFVSQNKNGISFYNDRGEESYFPTKLDIEEFISHLNMQLEMSRKYLWEQSKTNR